LIQQVLAGTKARELMEQRSSRGSPATESVRNEDVQAPASPVQAEVINQEHLQLSLEEAFFLTYALGALQVDRVDSAKDLWDILQVFRGHSYFPPAVIAALQPNDPFLLHYVVYHHFRSLGWVVRDGVKFAVDYLLYERGVVFSHAAFAILIVPSYSDPYWFEDITRKKKIERERAKKNWHWLHCANRVQNQVLKTLVLVYVDVPSPQRQAEAIANRDVGELLKTYRVREFCTKRWNPNRNRE
jgi:tRNA-splicing endonuclease subunit Sen2